jgi:hypothetical protein
MGQLVASSAQGDQVLGAVRAKVAPRSDVVHLEILRGAAILATPIVPYKNLHAKHFVGRWIHSDPGLFRSQSGHDGPAISCRN